MESFGIILMSPCQGSVAMTLRRRADGGTEFLVKYASKGRERERPLHCRGRWIRARGRVQKDGKRCAVVHWQGGHDEGKALFA